MPHPDAPPLKRKVGRPAKPKAPPKPRGRPKKVVADVDNAFEAVDAILSTPIGRREVYKADAEHLRIVGELARIFCTQKEIAAVLGITVDQFKGVCQRQPEVREALDDGGQYARASLRRKQFDLAGKNHPMSIFLGKNYLDQKDVQTVDSNVLLSVNEMSDAQLIELAGAALPPARAPSKALH